MSQAQEKLSHTMIYALTGARDHATPYIGCTNRSEYGARTGTCAALRRRGLLDREDNITDAGRAVLEGLKR